MSAFLDSTSDIKKGPSSSNDSNESLFECNKFPILNFISSQRQGIHLKISTSCEYVRK